MGDAGRLALVGAATFLETYAGVLDGDGIVTHCQREHSPLAFHRYLASGARAWLAEAGSHQAPVGYALLAKAELPGSAPDNSDVELKRIYALSRYHGGGLAARLMECAVEQATRQEARRLLLGVYAGNARAIAFYGKNGFTQIAERRFRFGDREYVDVVLARMLT